VSQGVDPADPATALVALADAVRTSVACPELAATRTTVVVGVTPPGARLLLVGEAPGAQEDLAGIPFVGKAGRLLDELMAEAGLCRADAAVLNVLKCRPPGNRTPNRAEVRRCTGWLDQQVEAVDPALVMTLGRTALTWALGARVTLSDVRGAVHDWRGRRLVASYHPSAAIRFGPNGAPRAALADDLGLVCEVLSAGARFDEVPG
jgi:uracil-DNA glycosylase family 4